ncbi:NAD(P)/FAD-dependent oxidoreductase [Hyphococcus sp.]|uniref:NAD(P)/FAD-dependent oxidoreductase n=1 Tax=Hyphococcus sp. TaxID=2038636 RepID=UPI003CCBB22E
MGHQYDLAIIGGGIAGLSIAYAIAGRASAILLEAESGIGYHSTGRSSAYLSCFNGTRLTRTLSRASLPFFESPPAGFSDYPLFQKRDCLWTCAPGRGRRLNALLALAESEGSLNRITPEMAATYCPALKSNLLEFAALEQGSGDIDVDQLQQALLKHFKRSGGVVENDARVYEIKKTTGGWILKTGEHEIHASVIVNAAGAWADEIASLAGARPQGLSPLRRTVITFDPPQGLDIRNWPFVVDSCETLYFRPDAGRILCSPADQVASAPCDAQPEMLEIATAVMRVEGMTHFKVDKIKTKWAGLRTFAPNREPVIGWDPSAENFFWFAAMGGSGIQTSPALSRLAVGELLEESDNKNASLSNIHMEALRPRPSPFAATNARHH